MSFPLPSLFVLKTFMIFSQLRDFVDNFHRGCSGILSRIMLCMNPGACRELGLVLVLLTKKERKKIQTNETNNTIYCES